MSVMKREHRRISSHGLLGVLLLSGLVAGAAGCHKKPPVATPNPPSNAGTPGPTTPPVTTTPGTGNPAGPVRPPAPPDNPVNPVTQPANPTVTADPWANKTADEINDKSPLKPVLFAYDSDQLDEVGKAVLAENAKLLKSYPAWTVTVEGHSDERGTAEYNLALGDRRALAAKNYLLSLGIAADRLRAVSYGEEFPFDPGHTETAWTQNRRAHFMVTGTAKH